MSHFRNDAKSIASILRLKVASVYGDKQFQTLGLMSL